MKRPKRLPILSNARECMHGYSEKRRHCAICHHDADQCDWGDCQAKHAIAVKNMINGRHAETRNFCAVHAELSQEISPPNEERSYSTSPSV